MTGSLYAHSSRVFQMNGHAIPYAWNHTIDYEHKYGRMPFLVERLTISEAEVNFDHKTDKISYHVRASIAKGLVIFFLLLPKFLSCFVGQSIN